MANENAVAKQAMLIEIGEGKSRRKLAARGFYFNTLEEHLKEHLAEKLNKQWCDISCVTRVFYSRSTASTRATMREQISKAFPIFLKRGLFLAIERGKHRKAIAIKFYNPGADGKELEHAKQQLDYMRRFKQISEDKYKTAQLLLGFVD